MGAAVTVTDSEKRGRFEARMDGVLTGFAQYQRGDEVVEHTRTVVSRAHRGQGVGGELARAALDDARRRGLKVKISCDFLAAWVDQHPEYRDLLVSADR